MPVSIEITRLRVRSLDRNLTEISWELRPTQEDVLDYTFQVLRSESPSGPFDPLDPPFQDRYLFIDNAIWVGDRWRTLHYIVRITHAPSGATKDFGPIMQEPEADLIGLELRRHIQLLMHEYAGRKCWALPLRTFGQRCECWDPRLFKRTRSRCELCFDTGFVRGYMSPIEVWMMIDPSAKKTDTTNVGVTQQSNTTARIGYYPPLKPGDLLIEPENRRWRVVQVNQTEQVRAAVHQEILLHEIPPRDIEFAVPLELGQALKDIWFSPPRNYTMPTNLQNVADTDILDPFSIYPSQIPDPSGFGGQNQ
jgi:hypothetical protein